MFAKTKTFYGWYVAICCSLVYFFVNSMTLFVPQNLFPRLMEEFSINQAMYSFEIESNALDEIYTIVDVSARKGG